MSLTGLSLAGSSPTNGRIVDDFYATASSTTNALLSVELIIYPVLEGKKRGTFLEGSPLKTVYVFKSRQSPMPNGESLNKDGKPFASTMAFAWFVWERDYLGSPTIRWI